VFRPELSTFLTQKRWLVERNLFEGDDPPSRAERTTKLGKHSRISINVGGAVHAALESRVDHWGD